MKTIAQQLNIKSFPFEIKDTNDNLVYHENSNGYWSKRELDANGKEVYWKDSSGCWWKSEYDANGNQVYYEYSNGYWWKREYDANGNQVYSEDSNGDIRDNRPKVKEFSMDEIAAKLGIPVNELKIKK